MKIYAIQSTSIKVPLGWVKKVKAINARENKIFNVSYLFTQKRLNITFTILRIQT